VRTELADAADLVEPLRQHLPRQRWYSGSEAPSTLVVVEQEVLEAGVPALVDLLVDADGARYQVALGLRPSGERPEFLRGREDAVLGEVPGADGPLLAYDGTLDPELALLLLDIVSGGKEAADRVRPVGGEQSNSSLVYDDRVILKLFRRLHPGRNLDVEMTEALADSGFSHVARPLATMSRSLGGEEYDLVVVQPFLIGGVDGWALALTSLRDLFGVGDTQPVPIITDDMPPPTIDPGDAGGDFSAEARRLGTITGDMHVALADAFGQEPGNGRQWADLIEAQLESVDHPDFDRGQATRIVERLRALDDVGPSIRIHGDYHLGQVLRTDSGWYVLDFEGEPDRPPDERRRPSSPLRDVAGMVRSLHYASEVALFERERDGDCVTLAQAWEERNRASYLDGYMETATKGGLLPDPASTEAVLEAFELEKAVYELNYERAHRPDWERIPLRALARLGSGR
jgi:maltokinase